MEDLTTEVGSVRTVVARIDYVHTAERGTPMGADVEHAVAHELAGLPDSWRVHSVHADSAGTTIDHVVVGPCGVFTVTTKNLPHASVWVAGDAFLVNRTNRPYIRNARCEARRAGQLLTALSGFPVPVIGVIALLGAHKGFTQKSQPADGAVHVAPWQNLVDWLLRHSTILTPERVDLVSDWARRAETWEGTRRAWFPAPPRPEPPVIRTPNPTRRGGGE